MVYSCILTAEPTDGVHRIPLVQPSKGNAQRNLSPTELFDVPECSDRDFMVWVSGLSYAATPVCADYDLSSDLGVAQPSYAGGGSEPAMAYDPLYSAAGPKTGHLAMGGVEAKANRCAPVGALKAVVAEVAQRVVLVRPGSQALHKRPVNRQVAGAGIRVGRKQIISGALTSPAKARLDDPRNEVKQAMTKRDRLFGGNRGDRARIRRTPGPV